MSRQKSESVTSRLNVNMNARTKDFLMSEARRKDTTATEIVRHALELYRFIEEAKERGDEVHIVDPTGKAIVVRII